MIFNTSIFKMNYNYISPEYFTLTVIVSNSGTQMRDRDSSATQIFFWKKNGMMQHWAQKITTKF